MADSDPRQIFDDVLAEMPASVLDASEQQRDRLQAARDEVIAIHAQVPGQAMLRDACPRVLAVVAGSGEHTRHFRRAARAPSVRREVR